MEKILIIDDSYVQIQSLAKILKSDYIIETCQDATEGIARAVSSQPNLILLDVIMPQMDGFEVLKKLKENNKTKNIPIIMITSLSDYISEERGLTLGAVDYIIKPFQASIVKARVKTHTQLFAYRKAIEKLALLDSLTGIPNRRSYENRRKAEWDRCLNSGQAFSIGLIDVDFFKQYNDNYGHPMGDLVLVQIAATFSKKLSASHFGARYGGEEFVFILPEMARDAAFQFAQQICLDIENLQIIHEYSASAGFVTVSIGGLTLIPQKKDLFSTVISRADALLYQAKNSGRNMALWDK